MTRFLPCRHRAVLLALTAAIAICCALPAGAFAAESGGFSEASTPENSSGSTGWVPQGESTGGSNSATAPQHGSSIGSGGSGTKSTPPPAAPVESPEPPETQAPPSEPSSESFSEPESPTESGFEETATAPPAESGDEAIAPPVTEKKDKKPVIAGGATQVIAPAPQPQAQAQPEATAAPAAPLGESDDRPISTSTALLLIAFVLTVLLIALIARRRAAERLQLRRERAQAEIDRAREARWEAALRRVAQDQHRAEAGAERRNGHRNRPVKIPAQH